LGGELGGAARESGEIEDGELEKRDGEPRSDSLA
jgi:hypothetical protein